MRQIDVRADASGGTGERVGSVVLLREWSMAQAKQAICDAFPQVFPDARRVRLRENTADAKPAKAYVDSKTLKENVKRFHDGKQLVVQKLVEEEFLNEDDLLVYVCRWHPEAFRLDAAREIGLSSTMTYDTLKHKLGNLALSPCKVIPFEYVQLAKPFSHTLRDLSSIPSLLWDKGISGTGTLEGPPWRTQHGHTIVYKDSREVEREITKQEKAGASAAGKGVHREQGLKIWTPAEQQVRREQQEQQKREREMAHQAAIEAVAVKTPKT